MQLPSCFRPLALVACGAVFLSAGAAASIIDGWHAAGIDGLDGRPLSELRACGAGGQDAREAFASFDPGTNAVAERELAAGRCDVSLSGAGSNMAQRMADLYPSRTIYRLDGGVLRKVADGRSGPAWILLAKKGAAVPALHDATLCGTGAWRDLYRRKAASTSNVYPIAERLGKVDLGTCDLAVFNPEELTEMGARANDYDRYVLGADAIEPHP